jgi:TIR domain-containing protein
MGSSQGRGGVFISYRREETAAQAGRLYDHLSGRFGEDRVFMDVDSISIGTDFAKAIGQAVSRCGVLLALIGPHWSAITDVKGVRRLDYPHDFVRLEIETALQRDIRVVPVLIDGAALPQAGDLPPSLRPLVRRQALELSHAGFRSEVSRLITAIAGIIDVDAGVPAVSPAASPRAFAAGRGSWKLELVETKWGALSVRLTSGADAHYITWNYPTIGGETITVDGRTVFKNIRSKQQYPLTALSSVVGADVTVIPLRGRGIDIRIGDQTLGYRFFGNKIISS